MTADYLRSALVVLLAGLGGLVSLLGLWTVGVGIFGRGSMDALGLVFGPLIMVGGATGLLAARGLQHARRSGTVLAVLFTTVVGGFMALNVAPRPERARRSHVHRDHARQRRRRPHRSAARDRRRRHRASGCRGDRLRRRPRAAPHQVVSTSTGCTAGGDGTADSAAKLSPRFWMFLCRGRWTTEETKTSGRRGAVGTHARFASVSAARRGAPARRHEASQPNPRRLPTPQSARRRAA